MYLGIDIGGTKTLIALFSRHGRIVKRLKFRTADEYGSFVDDLMVALDGFKNHEIKAVAVAVPGAVQKNCSVSFGNRDWGKVNLYAILKSYFNCPVFFENDASLAAVYESRWLPGKTVFLTFSTGIGGGVAVRGKLLPESSQFEPGHKIYSLDGATAEWEDIAAASALEKHFGVHPATDLRGKAAVEEIARRVALGLPDIVATYHPDTIILGGPLGKIFRLYVKYLPKLGVRYRRPKRPLESVIYGCYLHAKSKAK